MIFFLPLCPRRGCRNTAGTVTLSATARSQRAGTEGVLIAPHSTARDRIMRASRAKHEFAEVAINVGAAVMHDYALRRAVDAKY